MADQTNVELVRQGFEAMREGDVEALMPFIHPDFEATTPPSLAAEPDTYRGPEGIRRYFESFYDAMDRVSFEAEDFIPVGDRVVVPTTLHTRGRTTGIETTQRVVTIWDVKGEQAIRVEVFATLEQAMAAARGEGSGAEAPEAPG
jgi:ketosteroid isomerase-like protein